ncbi:hypothetical protein ROA7450_00842 [Roseovarius albus]|uniref:DUF2155 domain-containing protein n=1 Tax=Roseovarius albus TaxID=1247867 RepID=A0A1X6YJ98_9RHOB|nr:DUF2155 domain-containing protein [Roseovarius albus]SLN22444.1 hypothetical protein ROA7450_00842 [Roseovarius albus]
MRSATLALLVACAAGTVSAQQEVSTGTGAVLRGLDKLTGHVEDITLENGGSYQLGRLTIALDECRFPKGNAVSDAFAFLTIMDEGEAEPAFRGWMMASSPALNAMEHPRYDVWVMRCSTLSEAGSNETESSVEE